MAPDLGTKYNCFKCGSKFYDLRKPIPICPKCGADQRDSPPPEHSAPTERKRARPKAAPDSEVIPTVDEEAAEPVLGDAEDEDEESEDDVAAEAVDEEA